MAQNKSIKRKGRFHTKHIIEKEPRHHIIEWSAAIISIIGAILNSRLDISGFYFFSLANFLWIAFSLKHKHYGLFITNIIFFALNIYGIYVWKSSL